MADETAPIGLAMTASGDIEITTGTNDSGLRFASGLEAVTNNIRSVVQLFQGEWFADKELGVPYFQDILGTRYDEKTVLSKFREAVFTVPYVSKLQKLTSKFSTQSRTLTVYFEVVTDFGIATSTVEI